MCKEIRPVEEIFFLRRRKLYEDVSRDKEKTSPTLDELTLMYFISCDFSKRHHVYTKAQMNKQLYQWLELFSLSKLSRYLTVDIGVKHFY